MYKLSDDLRKIIVLIFVIAIIVKSFPVSNKSNLQVFNSFQRSVIVMSDTEAVPLLPAKNRNLSESFEDSLKQNMTLVKIINVSGYHFFSLCISLLLLGLLFNRRYHSFVNRSEGSTYFQKCIIKYIYNISSLG